MLTFILEISGSIPVGVMYWDFSALQKRNSSVHALGLQCAAKEKLQCSCTGTSVRCKRETPVFMHNKHDIIFQHTGVSAAGAACCNPST